MPAIYDNGREYKRSFNNFILLDIILSLELYKSSQPSDIKIGSGGYKINSENLLKPKLARSLVWYLAYNVKQFSSRLQLQKIKSYCI